MARSRNIKPGFFKNEDLIELPFETRLLFIGLWTLADREGRLEDRPKRIKIELFPGDNCDVDDLLQQLADKDFIIRYEVNGKKYIAIPKFKKHQQPHVKEKASEIPAPGKHRASTGQQPESSNISKSEHKSYETENSDSIGLQDLHRMSTGQAPGNNHASPSDSFNLIPESFNLIPESFNPTTTESFKPSTYPITGQEEGRSSSRIINFYEQNIGLLSPLIFEKLVAWEEETEEDLVLIALEKAVLAGKRNFSYAEGILKNWRNAGIKTRRAAEIAEREFQQQRRTTGQARTPPGAVKHSDDRPLTAEEKKRLRELDIEIEKIAKEIPP